MPAPNPQINVIGGMPKSGSTLLCNILNQNPAFHASDTSPLGLSVARSISAITGRPEYISELAKNEEMVKTQLSSMARSQVHGWYKPILGDEKTVIFDKDRSNVWLYQHEIFPTLFPKGRMIMMVRDPREVFGRILKVRAEDPLVRDSENPTHRTLEAQADLMMGPNGLVGSSIMAIQDVLQRGNAKNFATDHVLFIEYENFVRNPKRALEGIYKELEIDYFDHDFENVINVAGDFDPQYRNQWKHRSAGKVEPQAPIWPLYVPRGIAKSLLDRYPIFCQAFKYA